jgi:hypothetical protein
LGNHVSIPQLDFGQFDELAAMRSWHDFHIAGHAVDGKRRSMTVLRRRQTMIKLWQVFLPATVVLASLGVARDATAGDDALDADVASALSMRAAHRMKARECESLVGSEAGWQLRWAEYFWESTYVVAFHEAEAYLDALSKEQRLSLDSRIDVLAARLANEPTAPNRPDAACLAFAGWKKGEFPDLDLPDSSVIERLQNEHARRVGGIEAVRREVQRKNAQNGCMKQAFNKVTKPADFDDVHGLCVCVNDAIASSATSAEIDANDQFATDHGKADSVVVNRMLAQPSIQAAAPKMAACLEAHPGLAQQLRGTK